LAENNGTRIEFVRNILWVIAKICTAQAITYCIAGINLVIIRSIRLQTP
jgi:hypothetical protein